MNLNTDENQKMYIPAEHFFSISQSDFPKKIVSYEQKNGL